MKNARRDFFRKSVGLAAALSIKYPFIQRSASDAGMQMSEAYFDGFNQHKIALCKQMDVLGAVAGINPKMIGLNDAKPWDLPVIQAVKNAWDNEGLTLRVIEGPPALGEKTKLGLEGRDEEIANFITFMHNIAKAGIDTICYNWMPVIGWYRTDNQKRGRGGALV